MEHTTIDNLNKVGNVELGKRVQAMTAEEQRICAENIPVDILLDVIGAKFARYQEFELNVISLMDKFSGLK